MLQDKSIEFRFNFARSFLPPPNLPTENRFTSCSSIQACSEINAETLPIL